MGNHNTYKPYQWKKILNKEELVSDYFSLFHQVWRRRYKGLQKKIKQNKKIALDKKYFDRMVSIRYNLMEVKVKDLTWESVFENHFNQQLKEGIFWYEDLLNELNSEIFIYTHQFQSWTFFEDFFNDFDSNIMTEYLEDSKKGHILYDAKSMLGIDEENILKKLLSNQCLGNESGSDLSNSKINLSKVTENLGGSFYSNFNDISEFSDDLKMDYKERRSKIKILLKEIKRQLKMPEHPITRVLQIFEQKISTVIKAKIIEISGLKKTNKTDYYDTLNMLSEEIAEQIKSFLIKAQSACKMFYCKVVDLNCFFEEKDEMLNLITGIFFEQGELYDNLYQLYSLLLEEDIKKLVTSLKDLINVKPSALYIPVKFCLDEETYLLQRELKAENKEKDISNCDENINSTLKIEEEIGDKIEPQRNTIFSSYSSASVRVSRASNAYLEKNRQGYNTVTKILKEVKNSKIPFEKMLYVASVSTEITECINVFWKDCIEYTSPTFLHINADELMSLYIYMLIKSQMGDIIIHTKFIEDFTSKTTKKTMIGYYTTTLEAAIEYIQKGIQLRQSTESESTNGILTEKEFTLDKFEDDKKEE
ncbi:MAG: VPS9 domain-containing protein [archaeon]|nr:VPS9 domain-containing protein [archaeon]